MDVNNISAIKNTGNGNVSDTYNYEMLFNIMAQGVVFHDSEGRITAANPSALRLLGLSLDQLQGRTSFDPNWKTIHTDGSEFPGDQHPAMVTLRTGKAVNNVVMGVYHPIADKYVWLLVNSEPEIVDELGKPKRIFVTFTDITEQIESERELVYVTRLQEILMQLSNTFINLPLDLVHETVNSSLRDLGEFIHADRMYIIEYDFATMLSYNTYEWCAPGVEPQIEVLQGISVAEMPEWVETHQSGNTVYVQDVRELDASNYMREVLEPQGIISLIAVPIMDGDECLAFIGIDWVHERHSYTDAESELLGIFAKMYVSLVKRQKDITALQESEGRMRGFLNAQTNYVIRTDLSGRHTYWNRKFDEDFGWLYSTKGIDGSDTLSSICDYHQERAAKTVEICMREPGRIVQVELDKMGQNGGVMTTLWDFVCLTDAGGNPIEIQCVGIDITEMRSAEEQVRILSRALEQSPVSIVITNLDGAIEYANPMTFTTTGYTPEELLGKNPRVLKSGETSKDEYETLWTSISTGGEWRGIFHNRKKSGELYWESSRISPIFGKDGQITHYMAIKEDITEKKRVEDALVSSEDRYRELAEFSRTVIWEVDHEGKYTYLNKASANVFGYEPEELVGKMYFYELHPGSLRDEYREKGMQLIKSGVVLVDFINPIQKKDGSTIWVSSNAKPLFDSYGSLIGYRGADNDITERKLAEDEAHKFKIISDQANYGSAITTPDGYLIYVNDAFALMHGWIKEDLIGQHIQVLHSEAQMPQLVELVGLIHSEGGFAAEEVGHCRKDGTEFPTLMSAVLIKDENGNPSFMSATAIDITEIKEAEEKIKQQNARLSAFMNAMPDIIFLTNRQGDYLEYFHSIVNKDAHDYSYLVGKNVNDAFEPEIAKLHLDNIQESLDTGQIITYEYPRFEDGVWKHYEGRIVALDDESVLRFVRDITTHKAYENEIKKLTMAIEQSPVAIVITDLNANIQYASPAFFDFTGYTPDEVIGQNTKILKSGKTPDVVYADMWVTITKGETWRGEWVNKKKNGEMYWESISITPIVNSSGQISEYLAIKEEITERKMSEEKIKDLNATLENRIEERTKQLAKSNTDLLEEIAVRRKMETELLLARNEAEMANQAKSEFLSRMSHELRTPMNSILGFAQLLGMSTLTESQLKSVKHILRGGEHLLSLINEVLDISRIESGTVSLSIEPVEINGLVNELIDAVTPYAQAKNISVLYDNLGQSNLHVSADRQRLKQIFLNLIDNAIKYNKENGSVSIYAKYQEGTQVKKPSVRISVVDTGIGIGEDNLGKVFNPFERIGADNSQIEGTGLGLAVVKKLTELMYGKLGVTSEVDLGSTFWVEFDFSEPIIRQSKKSSTASNSNLLTSSNMKTVLYVEDNMPNVELVEQVLESARPNIRLINTIYGEEAIGLATEHSVDLILLDLNLPDIHGSEVLEKIRTNRATKSIPVVVISADAMSKQKELLIQAGANDYLTKPLVLDEFLGVVDKYIR
jgi:PAS domain S-box-containing protein